MLNAVQIIARKRDGSELGEAEIAWFIAGFSKGDVPDYQMSALAMAIFLNGMTPREIATLTDCMLQSGTVLEHEDDGRPLVDKHSTGGIGDKVSLILAPLLACCDLRVPMLSGRGLGPTGGTLDKLEAIDGFRTDLSIDEMQQVVRDVGCVITGASEQLAPADRKLYALRDVTGTVPCVPLITASIMSKKLAESLDALVLDVKYGSGAFMQSLDDARELALSLVATGSRMNLATTAMLTDMNQPLGRMCGNANELVESLRFLRGAETPGDLREVTLALCAELLVMTKRAESIEGARATLEDHIASGRAMERFENMVLAQGGNTAFDFTLAPATDVAAMSDGYITAIDTREIGFGIIDLGGGRRVKGQQVDHSVGVEMLVRLGDQVAVGQPLMRVFSKTGRDFADRFRSTIMIGSEPVPVSLLVADRITE